MDYCAVLHNFSTLKGPQGRKSLPVKTLLLFGGVELTRLFFVNHYCMSWCQGGIMAQVNCRAGRGWASHFGGCGSALTHTVNSLACAIGWLRKKQFCSTISLPSDSVFLPFPHSSSVALCPLDLVRPRPKPHNLLWLQSHERWWVARGLWCVLGKAE